MHVHSVRPLLFGRIPNSYLAPYFGFEANIRYNPNNNYNRIIVFLCVSNLCALYISGCTDLCFSVLCIRLGSGFGHGNAKSKKEKEKAKNELHEVHLKPLIVDHECKIQV